MVVDGGVLGRVRVACPRYGERARRPYRTVPPSTAGPAPVHRQSPPITASHRQSPPITANHRRAPFVLLHMRFCCTAYPGNVTKTMDHASPRSRSLDGSFLCSWCVWCPTRTWQDVRRGGSAHTQLVLTSGFAADQSVGRPARRPASPSCAHFIVIAL